MNIQIRPEIHKPFEITGAEVCRRFKEIAPSAEIPEFMLDLSIENQQLVTQAKLELFYLIFNMPLGVDPEEISNFEELYFNTTTFSQIFIPDTEFLLSFVDENEIEDEESIYGLQIGVNITEEMEKHLNAKQEIEDILLEVEYPIDTYLILVLTNPHPSSYFIKYEILKGESSNTFWNPFQGLLTIEGELNNFGKAVVMAYAEKFRTVREELYIEERKIIENIKSFKEDKFLIIFEKALDVLKDIYTPYL